MNPLLRGLRAAVVALAVLVLLPRAASAGPLRAGMGLDLLGRFHNSAYNVPNSSDSDPGVTFGLELVALDADESGVQLALGVEWLLPRNAGSYLQWAGEANHSYLGLYGTWRWRPLKERPGFLVLRGGWTFHSIPDALVAFSDAFGTFTWGAGVGAMLRGGWSVEALYVAITEGRAESRVSPHETILDGYDRVALMVWHRF